MKMYETHELDEFISDIQNYISGMRESAFFSIAPIIDSHNVCSVNITDGEKNFVYKINTDTDYITNTMDDEIYAKYNSILNELSSMLGGELTIFAKLSHCYRCARLMTMAWNQEGNPLCKYCEHSLNKSSGTRASDRSGYVYVIEAVNVGIYKIGMSIHPKKRFKVLSKKVPLDMRLLHTIHTDDRHNLEHELHEKYSHCRVNREWFKLSQEELDEILAMKGQ